MALGEDGQTQWDVRWVAVRGERADLMRMTASNTLNNLVTAITGLAVARAVEPSAFGLYSTSVNLMMILAALADMGIGIALVRYWNTSETSSRSRAYVLAASRLKVINSLALMALSIPVGWIIAIGALHTTSAFALCALALCGAASLNLWTLVRAHLQAQQDYIGYAGITLKYAVTRLALLTAALTFGVHEPTIVLTLLYVLAPLIISPARIGRITVDAMTNHDRSAAMELKSYGRPLVISSLLYPLAFALPQFMLVRDGAHTEAALYGLALMFAAAMQPLNDAMRSYFIPKVANFHSKEEARSHMMRIVRKFPLFIGMGVVALACVATIYRLFLESKYAGGLPVIGILLGASVVGLLGGAINSVVHYLGVPSIDALSNILRICVVATVALLFVPGYGAIGGAVATVTGVVAGEMFTLFVVLLRLRFDDNKANGGQL